MGDELPMIARGAHVNAQPHPGDCVAERPDKIASIEVFHRGPLLFFVIPGSLATANGGCQGRAPARSMLTIAVRAACRTSGLESLRAVRRSGRAPRAPDPMTPRALQALPRDPGSGLCSMARSRGTAAAAPLPMSLISCAAQALTSESESPVQTEARAAPDGDRASSHHRGTATSRLRRHPKPPRRDVAFPGPDREVPGPAQARSPVRGHATGRKPADASTRAPTAMAESRSSSWTELPAAWLAKAGAARAISPPKQLLWQPQRDLPCQRQPGLSWQHHDLPCQRQRGRYGAPQMLASQSSPG